MDAGDSGNDELRRFDTVPGAAHSEPGPDPILVAGLQDEIARLQAILGQQKVIGGVLGSKVGVRQAVGVNSVSIRAIRLILQEKGLSPNK